MKKILIVLSLMLVITVAKAQQTTGAISQVPVTTTVIGTNKQCSGTSKDCAAPGTAASEKKHKDKSKSCAAQCEGSKASSSSSTGTMSAEHVGTGSTVISTSASDDKCKGMKGKSCCKSVSKASAISNSAPQVEPASATPQGDQPK
jgi:hypothetical protein